MSIAYSVSMTGSLGMTYLAMNSSSGMLHGSRGMLSFVLDRMKN